MPGILNQLANSGAVWVIIAFVLGRFAPAWKRAALAGVIALVGEVAGYYTIASIVVGVPDSFILIYFWLAVALVAGPLLGAAGYFSPNAQGWLQPISTAALGAVFIGEGLYFYVFLNYTTNTVLWLAIALGITFLLTLHQPKRLQTFIALAALGLVFFIGEMLLLYIDQLRAATFQG